MRDESEAHFSSFLLHPRGLAMIVLRLCLLIPVLVFTTVGQDNSPQQRPVAPSSCPVTRPPAVPFTPTGEHKMGKNNGFWLGTDKLWTALPRSGTVWGWAPRGPGQRDLTAKIFWGSVDFDYRRKEDYDLKVTGRRLDGEAPPLVVD